MAVQNDTYLERMREIMSSEQQILPRVVMASGLDLWCCVINRFIYKLAKSLLVKSNFWLPFCCFASHYHLEIFCNDWFECMSLCVLKPSSAWICWCWLPPWVPSCDVSLLCPTLPTLARFKIVCFCINFSAGYWCPSQSQASDWYPCPLGNMKHHLSVAFIILSIYMYHLCFRILLSGPDRLPEPVRCW